MIERALLFRAWVLLGLIEAALVFAGFFYVLRGAGWSPGDDVDAGSPLPDAYLQATTMTLAGIVACQVETAQAPEPSGPPCAPWASGATRAVR